MFMVRRSKLYYTASGFITPVGGRPVHGTATYSVMIPEAVFDLLMMSTWCSKHVQGCNKLIVKQDFLHQVG